MAYVVAKTLSVIFEKLLVTGERELLHTFLEMWRKCKDWHLASYYIILYYTILYYTVLLASAHQSCLSRSLCRAFLPFSRSTHLLCLVSSANCVKVHLISLCRSLTKILNRTSPHTEPCKKTLVPGQQLTLTPFTTTLRAWPSSLLSPR